MALTKKEGYYYGDGVEDLVEELERYAKLNKYPIDKTEQFVCECGGDLFEIFSDEDEAAAMVQCEKCSADHYIMGSESYLGESLENYECLCGSGQFKLVCGLSFYSGTEAARWVYLGGYCPACGLVGNYVDWNER